MARVEYGDVGIMKNLKLGTRRFNYFN